MGVGCWLFFALIFTGDPAAFREPPRGSVREFKVETEREGSRSPAPEIEASTVVLFEADSGSGRRWIYFVQRDLSSAPPNGLPLGSLVLGPSDNITLDLVHPMEQALSNCVLKLQRADAAYSRRGWQGPEETLEAIDVVGLNLDKRVRVRATSSRTADAGHLRLVRELDGEPVRADFGSYGLTVKRLRQEFSFSESGRLIAGLWSHEVDQRYGESIRSKKERLTVTEVRHEPLTDAEVDRLREEFSLLKEVARATLPGWVAGARADQLTDALERYRTRFQGGLLAGVLPELERSVARKVQVLGQSANPDVRAEALINRPAPDFALPDLEGHEVALSNFKGRVIVVAFWGYT